MRVKICVEGGGNDVSTLRAFKSAFVQYCEKLVKPGRMPRIVAGGPRDDAYKDFIRSLSDSNYDVVGLLVDSEDPVHAASAIEHLRARDHWNIPTSSAKQIFLMTQCMESWFLADREALIRFYDEHFLENSLPARSDIEQIAKSTVLGSLEHATQHCQKRRYHKTRHGFAILALIDPNRIESASPHAKQFNDFLRNL